MTTDWAKEIKDRLTAREVFEYYGLYVNPRGFCKCPFHSGGVERTGSLKVYEGSKGWHCFGCGEGSTVIDFAMKYFNLPFLDACKKLNEDFRLGLPIDKPLTSDEQREINRKIYERQKTLKEIKDSYSHVLAAYHAALDKYIEVDKVIQRNALNGVYAPMTEEYCEALKILPQVEYELECAEIELTTFREKYKDRIGGNTAK